MNKGRQPQPSHAVINILYVTVPKTDRLWEHWSINPTYSTVHAN